MNNLTDKQRAVLLVLWNTAIEGCDEQDKYDEPVSITRSPRGIAWDNDINRDAWEGQKPGIQSIAGILRRLRDAGFVASRWGDAYWITREGAIALGHSYKEKGLTRLFRRIDNGGKRHPEMIALYAENIPVIEAVINVMRSCPGVYIEGLGDGENSHETPSIWNMSVRIVSAVRTADTEGGSGESGMSADSYPGKMVREI